MITELDTVKARLGIADTSKDTLLTQFITACGGLFDRATGRTLARTVDFTQEFSGEQMNIALECYPFESLKSFEIKEDEEVSGWVPEATPAYLMKRGCVLVLSSPFQPPTNWCGSPTPAATSCRAIRPEPVRPRYPPFWRLRR